MVSQSKSALVRRRILAPTAGFVDEVRREGRCKSFQPWYRAPLFGILHDVPTTTTTAAAATTTTQYGILARYAHNRAHST